MVRTLKRPPRRRSLFRRTPSRCPAQTGMLPPAARPADAALYWRGHIDAGDSPHVAADRHAARPRAVPPEVAIALAARVHPHLLVAARRENTMGVLSVHAHEIV